MKRLYCLLLGHDWRFSYNHGMPFGISTERALEMLKNGESYSVYQCRRCSKQALIRESKYIILNTSDYETP